MLYNLSSKQNAITGSQETKAIAISVSATTSNLFTCTMPITTMPVSAASGQTTAAQFKTTTVPFPRTGITARVSSLSMLSKNTHDVTMSTAKSGNMTSPFMSQSRTGSFGSHNTQMKSSINRSAQGNMMMLSSAARSGNMKHSIPAHFTMNHVTQS